MHQMESSSPALEGFEEFLDSFKRATEERWRLRSIDPAGYGFQFQPGTRWNPGLSDSAIAEYQNAIGVRFPPDFKAFLRKMNGTDLPTLNVYGSSGHPPRWSVGVYSFPGDVERIRECIDAVRRDRDSITMNLAEQGFDLHAEAGLVPIIGHRYIVCLPDSESSVVLSIVFNATDAIVYGNSLREYLERDFLS